MSKVDAYGRFMFSIVRFFTDIPQSSVDAYENPLAIKLPKYDEPLARIEAITGTGWTIPTDDEDVEKESWLAKSIKKGLFEVILRNPILFPIHDSTETWDNMAQAKAAIKVAAGKMLPAPVGEWHNVDVTSDEAISMMVFAGLAGGRLHPVTTTPSTIASIAAIIDELGSSSASATATTNTSSSSTIAKDDAAAERWVADFSELVGLETRPGYERFGAAAYFDAEQRLVRIRWSMYSLDVRPGDAQWAHAKWVWRCSALMGITASEHLLMNHLIFANIASTASRETLPKNHPLRRLMKPFNHMTPSINYGAYQFLTTDHSLLHRAVSLTYKGLRDAFVLSLKTVRINDHPLANFRDAVAELGDNYPYGRDAIAFYHVLHDFVSCYFDVYYKTDADVHDDEMLHRMWEALRLFGESSGLPSWTHLTRAALIDISTTYIFHVTGVHHVVGNVAEYLLTPNFASPRIRANREVSDVEASHYGLLIAVLTGAKSPKLMSDFTHLLLPDEHLSLTTAIFNEFQANLTALEVDIEERNTKRKWKFHGFQPRRLLSSVSI